MRQFSSIQTKITAKNIHFYAAIGLTSVRFAELESLIFHIIEKLINSDDKIISSTLIEKNSLESNLNLLLKINRSRQYKEEKLYKIVTEIRPLKDKRNLFIHGVWSDVIVEANVEYMCCSNHKHIYKKLPDGREWRRYAGERFTLEELEEITIKINPILLDLLSILEELEEKDFH
ncbi:hypothetical protein [Flavobacterium sp. 5]|uniref:hypothetical protein n=1 Tax=Flavobacterium sp. 5 TaxID=2035199 RepID=UPI000C2C8323|nr:hypothetical protein [Flavobacterium sp. 5]PKB17520.1 hypothetical protein CLU82_2731 [Flavobacterium sp. 5]